MSLEWVDALLAELDGARAEDGPALHERVLDLLRAERPHYHWVGFYWVDGDALQLGAFRGAPTEHVRIPVGEGICGAAAAENATIIVPDVAADERYLACFIGTRSEIVVPIRAGGRVIGEIDVDSDQPDAFGEEDRGILEAIAERLGRLRNAAQ
jgi:L-methionine (R)-S-oxide reductase